MTKSYAIGPFRLDLTAGVLSRGGAPVALGPRGVAVLATLVAHANEFVQKARILEAAWPGIVVEEINLAVQISAIRQVFAKAPGGERWVETLPRRGYRFVGPLTELRQESPGAGTGSGPRSNLPAQLTSFIGRERELSEIKRLLPGKRLLTLVGIGGIGKTRLALQAAADVIDSFRDGVWVAELAPIGDAALVPTAVAEALGIPETTGTPLTHTLCAYLKSRQLLLVLDNCEHLLPACATLADAILRGAAETTIIATSREPLRVAGEQSYLLPTLSLPDPAASVEVMGHSEAVALFVERAQRQRLDFELNSARAPTLADLCIHLDGIPLALELAAARVRSMSVEQINARIDDRFRLLTDGARTAMPRQQTLRATLDWSYELLGEAEKAQLRRVAVFSGGFTLEAAKQVCGREGLDDGEALDLLVSLTDKSLVQAEERGGAIRYRLLETVRQYARERLQESGEEELCRDRHLATFLEVAERAEPQLTGAEQEAWFDRLETEHDNLRSALTWSSGTGGDVTRGLRLAGAFWRFWYVRGYPGEGRGWLSKLLSAAPAGQVVAPRAKALNGAGVLAWQQGDFTAAWALNQESLAIQRQLGDQGGIAVSLNNLGGVAVEQGDGAAAKGLYEESLAIRRQLGDRPGIAAALNNLGVVARDQGDFAAARQLYEQSLALGREVGDRHGIAISLGNLGEVARDQGDLAAARLLHEESLAIRRGLGDRQGIGYALDNLGAVAAARGDYASARALQEESLALRQELGDRSGIAQSLEGLAYVACALAKPARAARIWGGAERLREEIGAALPPRERPRYERQVAAARAGIGDDAAFDRAWQEGRAMKLEQMLEHALKGLDG